MPLMQQQPSTQPPTQQPAPTTQAPQQQPQGWMSWAGSKLWNAGAAVASGVGGLASAWATDGEQDYADGETEFESESSWESQVGSVEGDPDWRERGLQAIAPSVGRKKEIESAKWGSEELGIGYTKQEAEARFGREGVSAKMAGNAALLHAKGETDRHTTSTQIGDVFGQGEAEVSGVSGGMEASANLSKTGASAKAKAGAYLAQGEAKGQAGWRIPGTNIALTMSGGLSGAYGVGGEVSGEAGWGEDGFKMGGKASGALGLGGGLSFGLGVGKFDKNAGWFGGTTPATTGSGGPTSAPTGPTSAPTGPTSAPTGPTSAPTGPTSAPTGPTSPTPTVI